MDTAIIKVINVSYDYSEVSGFKKRIIKDISFNIENNKITALLGTDKFVSTVFLKIIADLIKPDAGKIISEKKKIFIPSEPSSFPWLNVKENIVYNLNSYDKQLFAEIIQMVGLSGYENHFPNNKSYGFRFRISVARALMNDADILIFDEPFAFMNSLTKAECEELLWKINSEKRITILYSTINVMDAVNFPDTLFVFPNEKRDTIEKYIITAAAKPEILIDLNYLSANPKNNSKSI